MAVDGRFPLSIPARIMLSLIWAVPACKAPQLGSKPAGPVNDYACYSTMRLAPDASPRNVPGPGQPIAFSASPTHDPQPTQCSVQQVAHQDESAPPQSETIPEPLPPPESGAVEGETFPIDLATALRLAGANNLQISFAAERVRAALARMDQADVIWVPSINAGLVYNHHAGRLQETEGDVFDVNRNSLFVGAGAVTAISPAAGGSSGPARMFVDLPLVDVLFEPLAARRLVQAAEADQAATFNDTLLEVAVGYLNLLQAHTQVAIAQEALRNAEELAKITEDFARAGEGLEADAQRAQAELNERRRDLLRAKESVAATSAELVRLLRLDPAVTLLPTDGQVAPIDLVGGEVPLRDLIDQSLAARPETARQDALAEETWLRLRQERWRPWMPHLYAGFSGGGFGGGSGGSVKSFSDRTDFDVAALWQLQNFGLGNAALRRQRDSIHLQAHIAADQIRDLIASEVSRTCHQVRFRREQVEVARRQVAAAAQALPLNFDGIRGRTLRPIEAQQAIAALAAARLQYLAAVTDFNRAQFELLRAIGLPPALRE